MKELGLFALPKAPARPELVKRAELPANRVEAFLAEEKPSAVFAANAPPAIRQARLSVDLPETVLRALKVRAAERGETIREIILTMLEREGLGR